LADYNEHLSKFPEKDINLLIASAETRDEALKTKIELGLQFDVGFGLDPKGFSKMTGAFYHEERNFIHATGFIMRPDGAVELAVYSSGSTGRIYAEEGIAFIENHRE